VKIHQGSVLVPTVVEDEFCVSPLLNRSRLKKSVNFYYTNIPSSAQLA